MLNSNNKNPVHRSNHKRNNDPKTSTHKSGELKTFTNLFEGKIFMDEYMKNKTKEGVSLFAMGGVNQIGLNMNLYHYKGTYILVDCGSGFTNKPGLDIVVPSTDFIVKNNIKVSALFITHLHEDHVGAFTYFFKSTGSDCVVYTTKLTYHFLKLKLEKANLQHKIRVEFIESTTSLDEKTPQSCIEVGNFTVRPIELAHSTPGMNAYLISTNDAQNPITVFHTGDWRFDQKPIIEIASDELLLAQIGDRGVNAVVCDSTNVFNPHRSSYEGDVAVSLSDLIAKGQGTVFVTTFGSNYGRLMSILRGAKAADKKVLILGKSLQNIMKVAKAAGMPEVDVDLLPVDNIPEIEHTIAANKLLVVATGCQGEYLAAMSKIARSEMLIGTGYRIGIRKGDTVIFSSKRIPGNEYKLEELYNLLFMLGAHIITENDHFVHASGHCSQPELLKLFQLLSPSHRQDEVHILPVHGSLIHTNKSCDLVENWTQTGKLNQVRSVRLRDGDVVNITNQKSMVVDHIRTEPIGVNGSQFVSMDSELMKAREAMQNGIVIVCLYSYKGRLSGFNFTCPGYLDRNESEDLISKTKREIESLIERKRFKTLPLEKISDELVRDIKFIVDRISFNYIRSCGKLPYIEFVFVQSFSDETPVAEIVVTAEKTERSFVRHDRKFSNFRSPSGNRNNYEPRNNRNNSNSADRNNNNSDRNNNVESNNDKNQSATLGGKRYSKDYHNKKS